MINSKTDCFLIGYNEVEIQRHRSLLSYLYGKKSHYFRDRIKYSLSHITHENETFSPLSFYNKYANHGNDNNLNIITESLNLAIAYLGTYLVANHLTFDYINSFQEEKQKLAERLGKREIACIGIITTYYIFPYPILEIIKYIRKIDKNIPIIIGGPYIGNLVRNDSDNLTHLMKTIDADIYIYENTGLQTMVNVVHALKCSCEIDKIANVYYKKDDSYVFTFTDEESISFNEQRVDWSLFERNMNRVINLQTAVSCPFQCNFCNYPKYAGKYKSSSIDYIETCLNNIYKISKTSAIQFVDDSFNIPKERFKKILRLIIKNKYNFKWSSYFRCQNYDEETIDLMRESGCVNVFIGIESGSQTILENMNKRTNIDQYYECIELFNKYNILSTASLIIGFPGETEKTCEETFNFIENAKPTFFQQRLWWYDKTAPISQYEETYNLKGAGYDWSHCTMNSNEAHDLADNLFFSVKNSIHITEYPLVLFFLNRGLSYENVISYLESYSFCNKEEYFKLNNTEESKNFHIHKMISSITSF